MGWNSLRSLVIMTVDQCLVEGTTYAYLDKMNTDLVAVLLAKLISAHQDNRRSSLQEEVISPSQMSKCLDFIGDK